MRRDIAKLETLRGLRAGVASVSRDIKTWHDALRAGAGQVAVQMMEGDARAFRELMTAAGLRDSDRREQGDTSASGITITISGDLAQSLLERITQR